jgi:hypothetical protein
VLSAHTKHNSHQKIIVLKPCKKCGELFQVTRVLHKNGQQRETKKEKKCCSDFCAKSVSNISDNPREQKLVYCKVCGKGMLVNKRNRNSITCEECRWSHCKMCGTKIKKNKWGFCGSCLRANLPLELKAVLAKAGIKGSKNNHHSARRSKNEIYFAELCASKFNVKLNEPMFNGWDADVILDDQKVAVLWNGVWHYKQIGNSRLQQIQNRDKIKIGEIEKAGYTSYIVMDMGGENKKFVESEFNKFRAWLKL